MGGQNSVDEGCEDAVPLLLVCLVSGEKIGFRQDMIFGDGKANGEVLEHDDDNA